ncbi:hypothetical protein Lser_V15G03129 [Lactuca serriola]
MSSSVVNLKNHLIPLEEINHATDNFNPQRRIGSGGFGDVYKGILSERTAAFKRLKPGSYQVQEDFRNELEMIARFCHENIISFIGYCDEANEMIIVYEYASNGSLDWHLQDLNRRCFITWRQRLKICIGAARGLHYLHLGLGESDRVIHRDIKSANILLDDKMVAKICDFGLSKFGPKNQPNGQLYTKVAGTHFYLDPTYHESGILNKASDVYSFGVVMFEMLCGMLAYYARSIGGESPQPLINLVRRYYDNELERLIDPAIKDQIDSRSFDMFKEIAYECISFNLKERPTMGKVVEKLEKALNIQEPQTPARSLQTEFDRNPQTPPYEEIAAFIECVEGDIGFSYGKPVAAWTIYKCLLHWNCVEAKKTIVFDRIIQIIISAIEDEDNNDLMAYWLSNASTLLFLLHKTHQPLTLPPTGFHSSQSPEDDLAEAEHDPELQDQIDNQMACWLSCASTFVFLIRKSLKLDGAPSIQKPMSPTFFRSSTSPKAETEATPIEVQHVEAKYPALLFELLLTEYIEKMCGIISDNSKKEVGSFLSSSIQASKSGIQGHHSSKNHWHGIVDYLNTLLKTFEENFVPTTIVKKILTEIFSYINVQLFNSFLLYPECCSIANGRYVNEGLAELKLWCREAIEKYAGSLFDELNHVRQATQFLIIRSKWEISYKRINNLCSILSVSQLHKICTTACFQDKNYLGGGFDEVIASLAIQAEDHNNASSDSLLLKDSSSIHFSVDDLADSLQVEDFANVNPAIGLAKYPGFEFLYN